MIGRPDESLVGHVVWSVVDGAVEGVVVAVQPETVVGEGAYSVLVVEESFSAGRSSGWLDVRALLLHDPGFLYRVRRSGWILAICNDRRAPVVAVAAVAAAAALAWLL